jgi:Tfp pilus assembly protein PilV
MLRSVQDCGGEPRIIWPSKIGGHVNQKHQRGLSERGGSVIPAIIGVVILSIALLAAGHFLVSSQQFQSHNIQVDAEATAQQSEFTSALRYDNSLSMQSALQNANPQTYADATGNTVSVTPKSGVLQIQTPNGGTSLIIVSAAAGQ